MLKWLDVQWYNKLKVKILKISGTTDVEIWARLYFFLTSVVWQILVF
jgi:hypothetical protein